MSKPNKGRIKFPPKLYAYADKDHNAVYSVPSLEALENDTTADDGDIIGVYELKDTRVLRRNVSLE